MSRWQAATNRVLRLPSPGGMLKRKTPEQWTFWTFYSGVRGRSLNFCAHVSSLSAERFKPIRLYSREARQAKCFC
jgi:hypothetical protein